MAATSSRQLKNICVLSRFHYENYKEFVQAPIDIGRAITERKLHLVYGGGDRGLSKLVSEAAFIRVSQVLGIIPKSLKPLGCMPNPQTGEELVVSNMQERISQMLNHAYAFIFLPGDLTTLEALITFASWAHLNIYKKPIAYKPEPDLMTLALDWATNDDGNNPRKKCKLYLTHCL
ncbi:cytokinin riboside 5'-monophosphate phosphoribohydrolase [Citrus sinensis]|uniref:Cytokinin riboside 5'-monophosphate phosphoribohydrolase n=1 Tax=Citrus sinensis TaxID=2711 RepID=A0ACB8NVI8_CITSI|nr:cytokinin riboside 5'-monophosphate phosphoribohydrolase [Citrus sinensis]